MSDLVSVRLPRSSRNTFYGKLVLLLGLSVWAGRYFALDTAADYAKGQALTLAQYTANFEGYRAHLMGTQYSVAVGVLIFGGMIGGFFAAYEVLGSLIGALIGRVLPSELDAPASTTMADRALTTGGIDA